MTLGNSIQQEKTLDEGHGTWLVLLHFLVRRVTAKEGNGYISKHPQEFWA